jgi:two-component system cell cycle sensor histidine kinase/response regulator CckA
MSDIDAPMRYVEPMTDRPSREGSITLVVLLALALAAAAVGLAVVSREVAEPFVLAILGVLAVVGVFCLFAGAVGILHFGQRPERNDLTKAFVDNLPNGALIGDASGRVYYANQAYRDLLGLDAEAPVPAPDRAFGGNPYLAEPIFRLARAAQQRRALKEEFRLPPPGDLEDETSIEPRWFCISVQPMPPDAGSGKKAPLTVWQVNEVTQDRIQDERNFEKVQAAIDYLDNAPAGFFTADPNGRIEYLNATLARWLKLDLTEMAGRPLRLSQIMSQDNAALLAVAGRGESQGTPQSGIRRFDIDLLVADGMKLPVRVLHRLPRGNQLAHVLTLSREQEEAHDAGVAELRYTRIFQSSPFAIATLNASGAVTGTNTAFSRLFGTGADPSPGKTKLEDLVDEGNRRTVRQALEAAIAGQGMIDAVDVTFAGSQPRSGRIYLSSLADSNEKGDAAIAYALDTTEQRALEAQFAQSQKMQAVGQLAGGIAHDFNNMLTAIIGFSDFLLMNHRPTDPAFQDIMNIKQNANRAAGLVRQLLAFSRQQTLRPQVLQLGDVLSDLSILLDRLLGENVQPTLDTAGDLWPVKADLHQFEQVIINLAVNARDAMPEGGKLTIRTANVEEDQSRQVGSSQMPAGEYVMIEVRDTGTGMTEDVKEKIFEPFFSTKEIGQGTGLGLSTVYGIIKQTGGYVYVDSELGKGTAMRVYLPRFVEGAVEVDQDPVKLDRNAAEKPKDLTGRGTLLLVEDEDAVRSFAARALGTRGYEVLEASTGAEALEVFEEHKGKVDLVVSDVVMPEMDGPALLKELRQKNPGIKIIFMSGYAEDAFKRSLDDNEEFGFLQKPFDLKTLATTVKSALED